MREANERDNIMALLFVVLSFLLYERDNILFLSGKSRINMGNVLSDYGCGNDVCVGRISGIIREMGGLYRLFQCFSAIIYSEGQPSLRDPVMCRYRSLCV